MDRFDMVIDSPLHSFALMLHERLERCEDGIVALGERLNEMQRTVSDFVKYRFFKIEFREPINDDKELFASREKIVNEIFKHRQLFSPLFAYMKWNYIEESKLDLIVHVFLLVKRPVSLFEMKSWIQRAQTIENFDGAYGELKDMIKNDIGFYIDLPVAHNDTGVEIWTIGGDKIDYDLSIDMTLDEFTKSSNYCSAYGLQCALHEHVKYDNWFELFGLE